MSNEVSERILDLAQDFIMKRGYKAFSYKDLSKVIGIKTSSIHYYFPTKNDLGKSLLRRYYRELSDMLASIDQSAESPSEKLKSYMNIFYENLKSGDKVCPVAMLASDYANLPDEVKHEVIELIQLHETWLTKVLKEGLSKKAFRFSGKPEDKAKAIFFAIEGATIGSRAFSNAERIRLAEDLMFKSIT